MQLKRLSTVPNGLSCSSISPALTPDATSLEHPHASSSNLENEQRMAA